jgi:two-component system CheB/CheR fusion protein
LPPGGFLFLGGSESIAAAPQLFECVHKRERIFTRLPVTTRVDFNPIGRATGRGDGGAKVLALDKPLHHLGKEIDQLLLQRFAPSGVLLNAAMEILEIRGSIASFIEPREGEASLNLFRIVSKELAVPLRVALHEARTATLPVRKEALNIGSGADSGKINLEVMRLRSGPKGPVYYLVLFERPPRRTRKVQLHQRRAGR